MKIGLGIGVTQPQNMPMASVGSPSYLFRDGAQGTWHDPSDIKLDWRRNLLTYSEQFDNAAWSTTGYNVTVSANTATAPNGTTTGDSIVDTSETSIHGINRAYTPLSAGNYRFSVYVKAGTKTLVQIREEFSSGGTATFNLIAATATGAGSPVIESAGGGWFRCSATWNLPTSYSLFNISTTDSYAGTGATIFYLWGAQLELGSTATPYQRITDGVQDYLQYQAQPVLFQNAAGTTPVTAVEQPVGLMLDKSKGLVLGPELVTNGDFSNGTTGWVTANGGAIVNSRCECTTSSNFLSTTAAILTVGKWYSAEFDYFMTAGAKLRVATKNTVGPDDATIVAISQSLVTNAVTRLKIKFQAAVGGFFILQASDATFSGWIDNISVRELPGNHAFNGSGNSANFPVLSARYNLLTADRDFTNGSYWTNGGAGAFVSTANSDTAPDGTNTACKLYAAGPGYQRYQANLLSVGASYTFSAWLRTNTGTAAITLMMNDTQVRTTVTVTTTWTLFTITGTITSLLGSGRTGLISSDVLDATKYVLVGGCDLRVANDALGQPAYQRVNTSTDYDTVGFKPYLRFNGTNQWLQTNSIDFSYGDKMFVSAGVRKLSDDTLGVVHELGNGSQTNVFSLWNGDPAVAAGARYAYVSGGTVGVSVGSPLSYASPITNVISGIGNISGDQSTLRINGVQVASNTGDQGTGNYGNYPLFIGARAGTSLWFNGRLYGMVVAGKQVSAVEIDKTEDYIALKTGFTYPKISGVPTFTVV